MKLIAPLVLFIACLLGWELGAADLNKPMILPGPIAIAKTTLANGTTFGMATAVTMCEAVGGFLLALIAAYLTAIVFVGSEIVRSAFFPYAIILKATPLVIVAPLVVFWLGEGMFSKIVLSATVAYFPILVNSVKGLSTIDPEVNDLMRSLSADWFRTLWLVRIPSSLPFVFSGMKIASTLAIVGAIIGELAGSEQGIGYLINTRSYRLETTMYFAAAACTSIGGVVFFGLIGLVERFVVHWEQPSWD